MLIIVLLIGFGLYWLFGHMAPFPLNHEQFGLYNHNIHRMIGVAFLLTAAFVTWKKK